jgi:hypothetical protein
MVPGVATRMVSPLKPLSAAVADLPECMPALAHVGGAMDVVPVTTPPLQTPVSTSFDAISDSRIADGAPTSLPLIENSREPHSCSRYLHLRAWTPTVIGITALMAFNGVGKGVLTLVETVAAPFFEQVRCEQPTLRWVSTSLEAVGLVT